MYEAVNRNSPRSFALAMQGMIHTINNRVFEMDSVAWDEIVQLGDLELWEFIDLGGGGGIYHPNAAALKQIRTYIAETPKAWEKVLQAKIPIEGDTLKRPPLGFDPKHRFVRDIQRKDFYSMVKFTEEQVCSAEFLDAYVKACVQVSPLVDFLTKALQLQW